MTKSRKFTIAASGVFLLILLLLLAENCVGNLIFREHMLHRTFTHELLPVVDLIEREGKDPEQIEDETGCKVLMDEDLILVIPDTAFSKSETPCAIVNRETETAIRFVLKKM